jgi:hypothetical protein
METKFDNLFKKIMCECKEQPVTITEENDIMPAYHEKINVLFAKVLADEACDLAEIIFKDEAEKQQYIDNAVDTYIDDIEAHIEGDVDPEEFMTLADDIQEEKVKAAIADNSEAIFGKDIFA